MNAALAELATQLGLDGPAQRCLRVAFALACVERVAHLIEDECARSCLAVLRDAVAGRADDAALSAAAALGAQVASGHRGSGSIDNSGHAAVSATHALAHALAGRALQAADYAAYASVYAYGGYAASDPGAFADEHVWQVAALRALAAPGVEPASSAPVR